MTIGRSASRAGSPSWPAWRPRPHPGAVLMFRAPLLFLALTVGLLPPPALAEPLLAFGQDVDAPTAWLGSDNHVVVQGHLNGREVEIGPPDLGGPGSFATSIGAERRYFYESGPGGWRNSTWRYKVIVVTFEVAVEGGLGEVTLVIRNDDFLQSPRPGTYPIVAHRGITGPEVSLRMRAMWQTNDTLSVEEAEGWTGTLTLAEDSGSPDDRGIMGDGRVGGVLEVERGADHLTVSFSAPVDKVTPDY
jgi:hypothetical protein